MKKHYRLCHLCHHLNSFDHVIEKCEKCQKFFVPYFFCDDLNQFIKSDHLRDLVVEREKSNPIIGISFVWGEE